MGSPFPASITRERAATSTLLYEDVSAGASTGFYHETLGAALLPLAGGGLFVLRGAGRSG